MEPQNAAGNIGIRNSKKLGNANEYDGGCRDGMKAVDTNHQGG